jgi:hypothetical protein
MKNILLSLFILVYFISCKPEPKPIPDKHNYYYLTAEQLAKTPYFTNPAFDTLTFVSNQNDTVVFAKTRVDSGWYREIEFDPGVEFTKYHYYQQISANYQTIKGDGSFGVVHSKYNLAFNIKLPDFIQISYNGYNFYLRDYFLDNIHPATIDTIKINNQTYLKNTKLNNNRQDSSSSQANINTDFGLFQIFDYNNSKEWILINQ